MAKSKDWERDLDWADIIIFDDTLGQGEKAQELRETNPESDWRHSLHGQAGG